MEQEIQGRVLTLTKHTQNRMAEETGIQSSLTEDDIMQYTLFTYPLKRSCHACIS